MIMLLSKVSEVTMARTPHGLSLRLSHLENNLRKDSRNINALYTHIFRDIRFTSDISQQLLETIERAVDESNILFLCDARREAIKKIESARELILSAIAPAEIMSKRLLTGKSDEYIGTLDELPDLVKNKIATAIAFTI